MLITKNDEWKPIVVPVSCRGITIEMCKVPPGAFQMGCDTAHRNSQPKHYQYLTNSYWISVNTITNLQWQSAVEESNRLIPSPKYSDPEEIWKLPDHPVTGLTGKECLQYANWLGMGFRLPSEPEWEYAARGPDNLRYPFGNTFQADLVVYKGNSEDRTASIGERVLGASWVGAQDMSGNVWEWVSSTSRDYPYEHDYNNSSTSTMHCVLRGGCYRNLAATLETSIRIHRLCNYFSRLAGFRIVIDDILMQKVLVGL